VSGGFLGARFRFHARALNHVILLFVFEGKRVPMWFWRFWRLGWVEERRG
jgi:hypothetical protein